MENCLAEREKMLVWQVADDLLSQSAANGKFKGIFCDRLSLPHHPWFNFLEIALIFM